ncbi:MAG: CidB/LrgB family autolysis modulator [Tuberibacillus sp.]
MFLTVFCIVLTIAIYIFSKKIYKRFSKVYLSPLLITPFVIVIILLCTHMPYETYYSGGKWLSFMLQPATIAFAVPLYKHFHILKKHSIEILAGVLSGSTVAIITSMYMAKGLHLSGKIIDSLIPRSVTTPIAMGVAKNIGGIPAVTAVFVIITGLLGATIGPFVIRFFRIDNDIARGVLFGTSSHAAGTSKAFEYGSVSGTISSLSMIIAAIITIFIAPWMLAWFS